MTKKKKIVIMLSTFIIIIAMLMTWWALDYKWQSKQLEFISNDIISALAENDIERFSSYCDSETKYNNSYNTWDFYNEYMPTWEKVNVELIDYEINNFLNDSVGAGHYYYSIYCYDGEGIKYEGCGLLNMDRNGKEFTIENITFGITVVREK